MRSLSELNVPPQLEISGFSARITLSRPRYANRLSASDLKIIQAHIDTVNQNDAIRVLQIIGTGKYFCSGYDLKSFGDTGSISSLLFGETVDKLEMTRPMTIAAINGGVYGGGTDLALACDFRIGTYETNMFMPASKLGLHFYPGGMVRYVTRLGIDQAKRLFLKGEKIESEEMLRIGFLTELVDKNDLLARIEALTEELASAAPLASLGIKKHLNLIARGEVRHSEIEQAVLATEASQDLAEGAAAWREKRRPQFTGK